MELLIKRFIALFIDVFIIYIPSLVIQSVLGVIGFVISFVPVFGFIGNWISDLGVFFILFFLYNFIMEYVFDGTLGKKLMKIKVLYQDDDMMKKVLRALLKTYSVVGLFKIFAIISLCIMAFVDAETSLHDKVVKSKVC